MSVPTSTLGRTDVSVTKLGYGAMELRSRRLDGGEVDRLLNAVLDAGINLIDTSPDYGASEEHIGRAISHRRSEYFLASKCGCPVGESIGEGGPAGREHVFTRENVRAAVKTLSPALRRVVILHGLLGESHEETARRLGIDSGTVRVRWHRAKRELQHKLVETLN